MTLRSASEPRFIALCAAAFVLAPLVAILIGQPSIATMLLLGAPLALLVAATPQLVIPLVIFVLYSNAAVVAVRYHGIPAIAAASLPGLLLLPLGRYLLVDRRPLVVTGSLPWIALFVMIQFAGVLFARHPDVARSAVQTSLLEGLILYALVTNVVRGRRHVLWATWALMAAGCLMGGLSLYQQLTGTFANDYGGFAQVAGRGFEVASAGGPTTRQVRLCGPIGEQNRYAQIMLMLVPLGLYLFWSTPVGPRKLLAAAATAVCALGCSLAFSRGAAIGFLVMLIVMTALRQLPVRHLAFIALGLAALMLATPQYRDRLASLSDLSVLATRQQPPGGELDGAIRGRATVMLAAIRVTADYPLLGVGPGMFNYYSREYGLEGGLRALEGTREAHSLYLELAAEHGILGLACFLAVVCVSLINLGRVRRAWRSRDPQLAHLATGYMLAIATYLSTGMFLHFSYARFFWLMLALADATSYTGRDFGGSRTGPRSRAGRGSNVDKDPEC
jgi:putative inorganic carbon (hco3(-)) transporter